MSDIAHLPAHVLLEKLRRREIGCLELLNHYLARIERFNAALNAIIWTDLPNARRRAAAADAALARGELWGTLHGLPMTVKESFDIAGAPSTWGMPALKGNIATQHAVAVERLLAAGAIVFGKTNIPTALADAHASNEVYGTTNNPWGLECAPGGSSGGSAAALAAGLTGLELGSDLGGSIRNPAHACGVAGHKPSGGIIPSRGHSPSGAFGERDLGVVGPLGRDAQDLRLALEALAGPDVLDARAWRLELPPPSHASLSDFRIAVLIDDPACPISRSYADAIEAVGREIERAGARVSFTARPRLETAPVLELYLSLLRSLVEAESYAATYLSKPADARVDGRGSAQQLAGSAVSHREWVAWDEARARMRWAWRAFFQEWDVLVTPIDVGPAQAVDRSVPLMQRMRTVDGVQRPHSDVFFWAALTQPSRLPATAAPIGLSSAGLPWGVQIIGDYLQDYTTIHVAMLLQQIVGRTGPPPHY